MLIAVRFWAFEYKPESLKEEVMASWGELANLALNAQQSASLSDIRGAQLKEAAHKEL